MALVATTCLADPVTIIVFMLHCISSLHLQGAAHSAALLLQAFLPSYQLCAPWAELLALRVGPGAAAAVMYALAAAAVASDAAQQVKLWAVWR